MENAIEALKMAAAVLVFVMALGISISSFSQARQTADTVIRYSDRESVTQYIENESETTRIVSVETIIPTLYRIFDENYRVVFESGTETGTEIANRLNKLYGIRQEGTVVERNYIDSGEDDKNKLGIIGGTDRDSDNFITALLYGNQTGAYLLRDDGTKMTFSNYQQELRSNGSNIVLNDKGIYDIIKGRTFEEKIGVYYYEDLEDTSGGTDVDVDVPEEGSVLDVNKTKRKIITYTLQPSTVGP